LCKEDNLDLSSRAVGIGTPMPRETVWET